MIQSWMKPRNLRKKANPTKRAYAKAMRRNPTPAEAELWQRIRCKRLGVKVRRQSIIRGYIVDFYIPAWRLAIELDGSFHNDRADYDANRTKAIQSVGIKVIRFANAAIFNDIWSVLHQIKQHDPFVIYMQAKPRAK